MSYCLKNLKLGPIIHRPNPPDPGAAIGLQSHGIVWEFPPRDSSHEVALVETDDPDRDDPVGPEPTR